MQRLVVGYGWRDGIAELRTAQGEPLVLRDSVAFALTERRECIGWRDDAGRRRRCPTQSEHHSGTQCLACSRREGFWQCMTCDGFECPELKPAMRAYCQADHVLYLACFGGPSIKVGTASGPRRRARLIDQGPLVAAHIAQAAGPKIKQLEAMAVRAGLTEAVRRSQKWHEFKLRTTPQQGRDRIRMASELLHRELPDTYRQWLHPPEFVELAPFGPFRIDGVELLDLAPGDRVQGKVVAARGHVCVVDDGAGRFAVDLGALRGRYIDLNPAAGAGPVRQLGLF